MTTYPPGLVAHLAQGVTTMCRCWRLTRRDGVVAGYTDHDVMVVADGTSFAPQTGFSSSEAKRTLELGSDASDIEGALSAVDITAEDIAAGLLDGATVETLLVNWRQPAQSARISRAMIGKITQHDGRFVAELESRMRFLDQPNGRYVLRRCDAELGDSRCGVALVGSIFTSAGAVEAVATAVTFTASGLGAHAAGWFTHGILTWVSGARAGQSVRIAQHRRSSVGDVLTLLGDVGRAPATGDTFSIVAGCDKSFATCKAKFANGVNFRGFPHLPGNDAAYAYASDDGDFDGGPVVP